MKTSLDHLPSRKQHELRRVVEIIHEEFDDALKAGEAEFKKRGRILKMLLFGLHAGGRLVDESVGTEGYRSDFDILIVVNNKKLTDPALWNRARDRLMRDPEIKTPVSVIVHALREVNSDLKRGRSFFVDIARDGIALYELDDEPLAAPGQLSPELAWRIASEYFEDRVPLARKFLNGARFYRDEDDYKLAAFLLHQSIEQAYSSVLLVLTNYSPTSHNLRFLRGLAEERAQELTGVWREDQQRYVAWFNLIDEAYIKARYSPHYEVSKEALDWVLHRTEDLVCRVEAVGVAHLASIRPTERHGLATDSAYTSCRPSQGFISEIAASTRGSEMDRLGRQAVSDHQFETLPPKSASRSAGNTVTCLCCQEQRPATSMDADGCGICEECLAP
ncbi:HEPN domain-containing protein (plasmid) [Ensifer adhaerens]|uniref:nucleotidyltransferase and HEPN domain-containing protein n=1 Tax=Ensifer adhaerens TaxID=106592 RepID=UPI002E2E21C3|nr:HEPN domain-containing protein [Ensifer adhaerens]UAX98164.1 HEPN domain-containing protein [Ensifer adhaerens]UAY05546.1 HEPN domain-containing protein [Ensifer adhaerens]UAY12924.1 HEPN domain-containing protein [Ensifer adhaerens]